MEDVKKGCEVDEEKTININENFKCKGDPSIKDDDLIESKKLEMTGVREENVRLKAMLKRIEKDYKTLQMQFVDIYQQKSKKNNERPNNFDDQEQELVSLRLGTNFIIPNPTETKKDSIDHVKCASSISNRVTCEKDDVIELGLGCNPEGLKTDDGPVSLGKNPGPNNNNNNDDDVESLPPNKVLKRARVCVRARCDTPTMTDGCQWRKYGQKIAKGNPCPRAYYRCTVSPSCPVRKQVQRCMTDTSILITTYEGTHNHPLPISAAAMASTTSAAASMLLSGSTTSPSLVAASPPLNLYGPPSTYWPNASATSPLSTVTLDLTTNPAAAHGEFSLYSSSSQLNPRTPTTSPSFPSMDPNMDPSFWGGGGFPNYNNFQNSNMLPGKSTQEQKYLSVLEKFNQGSSQQALTETLSRAITSDPSFRSVIASVVSSMAANGVAGKK